MDVFIYLFLCNQTQSRNVDSEIQSGLQSSGKKLLQNKTFDKKADMKTWIRTENVDRVSTQYLFILLHSNHQLNKLFPQ